MAYFEPYKGTRRTLILALDLGATFSSVAYALLDPLCIPRIHSVLRFPGQSKENGDLRIPSVICYADDGNIIAVGAEVDQGLNHDGMISVGRVLSHLCQRSRESSELNLPPLPPNKGVVAVIADFLAYLFRCTREYIHDAHPAGAIFWTSIEDNIEVIINSPNVCQGNVRQAKMREAAILAGIITDTPVGRARLQFITEGEATLHYCLDYGMQQMKPKDGLGVVVVNAGRDTVELATYKLVTADPIAVEETAPPACILQGSTRLNARFRAYLHDKLRNSKYGSADDIREMLEGFERSTKPTFENPGDRSFIKFGGTYDTDPSVDIRNGQLAIPGVDLVELFQPSVDGIVAAIRDQAKMSIAPVDAVFLVGSFSASPWLYTNLHDILSGDGMTVYRPDAYTNRAVSHGATVSFIEKFVNAPKMHVTLGIHGGIPYYPDNPEHYKRRDAVKRDAAGAERLYNVFRTFISENTQLSEDDVLRYKFMKRSNVSQDLNFISHPILRYDGAQSSPYWMEEDPDSYRPLFTVCADTTGIDKEEGDGLSGTFYTIFYDIVFTKKLARLFVQIAWLEGGVEKWSDAKIIPQHA